MTKNMRKHLSLTIDYIKKENLIVIGSLLLSVILPTVLFVAMLASVVSVWHEQADWSVFIALGAYLMAGLAILWFAWISLVAVSRGCDVAVRDSTQPQDPQEQPQP